MKNRTWLALAIAIVVGLGAGVGIGAAAWAGDDHSTSTAMDETADGMSHGGDAATMDGDDAGMAASLDERTFLEEMVPHHTSAVAMAEIAVKKAEHPEVRQLAQRIISSQEKEIGRMRAYYQDTFGKELVPSTTGPHASVDLSALETATDDFDRVFLAMMLPHHASAVTMADEVMMSEPSDEIMMLAGEIISAQAKEIGQMQQWRETWYPPLG